MSISVAVLLVLAGLAILVAGGEALLRGATALARVAGLTPAVIGLTVVAMGTSLPELVVSLLAAMRGTPAIALGNVAGSNIFNITATLGITALLSPLPVRGAAVRFEWPVMFLASAFALVVVRGGEIDRIEGGIFLLGFAAFTAYAIHVARAELSGAEAHEFAEEVTQRTLARPWFTVARSVGAVVVGIALLVLGGRLLVDGAVALARTAGITERVIGLTVVAVGTSVPELATSLIAALRGRTDVAVANMIGSNIFNILGILGTTALVQPIDVTPAAVVADFWWVAGTSLLLLPLLRSGLRLTRIEGAVLLGVYVVYVLMLL